MISFTLFITENSGAVECSSTGSVILLLSSFAVTHCVDHIVFIESDQGCIFHYHSFQCCLSPSLWSFLAQVSISLLICILRSDENVFFVVTRQQRRRRHKARNEAKVSRQLIKALQWNIQSAVKVREAESSRVLLESKLQRPSVRRMKCKWFLPWLTDCMLSSIIHDTSRQYQICLSADRTWAHKKKQRRHPLNLPLTRHYRQEGIGFEG